MSKRNRKIAVVGAGMVGMSYAYALLNQNACDELVLLDIDQQKAEGEAMDLNHGLAFSNSHLKIYAGNYTDCKDAEIVVIAAGVAQRSKESRLDLLTRNTRVFQSIVGPIVEQGFAGVFLVATNPVDIMTRITQKLSGFPSARVIGSGTTLDTARLRYLLGDYFMADPRNMHAYVIGEHGESEFVPWSQAMFATTPILDLCRNCGDACSFEDMQEIGKEVKAAAQKIIEAKGATYYGIGMALTRITKAILGDEQSVMTVSVQPQGLYGIEGVYLGLPAIVGRGGAERIIHLPLKEEEVKKLRASAGILDRIFLDLTQSGTF